MKRSVTVPLLLMGTAALSSCGEKVQSDIYVDADNCIASAKYDADKCVADYAVALKDHDTNAPAFSSLDACEANYGIDQCQPVTAAHTPGGLFIPKLSGYLMGTHTQEGEALPSRALYRKVNRSSFRDDAGTLIADRPGHVEVKLASLQQDQSSGNNGSGGGYGGGGYGGGNSDFSSGIARGGFGFGGEGGGHGGGGE
jgi:uncharacterized protein YgiB involved in biofilm formation